jgi:hypothetical protein
VHTKEVKISIQKVIGAATVFKQGGSLRLILPKIAFALLRIPKDPDREESDFSTVILIATSKGILVRALEDYLKDQDMKEN